MIPKSHKDFLWKLNDQLPLYLQRLSTPSSQIGRFFPCEKGPTKLGKKLTLGFSCFALKTYYMIGLWDTLAELEQKEWVRFIKSYQIEGQYGSDPSTHHAFVDEPLALFHQSKPNWRKRIKHFFKPQILNPQNRVNMQRAVILAETKQALATLFEVGEYPDRTYLGFAQTPEELHIFLSSLDWTSPWAAGGQASAQVVFVRTQAPTIIGNERALELSRICDRWFESLVDAGTGLYFTGSAAPQYGEAINGAMKVLTALDWLDTPIHYPVQLIDTCLSQLPSATGCHMVDAVYVLHRCSKYTSHRRDDVQEYCIQILDMIQRHFNVDGGFSYSIGKSQTGYYGATISKGLQESDIHGTVLLTWALAMILEIVEDNFLSWKVIKP